MLGFCRRGHHRRRRGAEAKAMRKFERVLLFALLLAGSFLLVPSADARCVCRYIDGVNQACCRGAFEVPPVCPPTACRVERPNLKRHPATEAPPAATSRCRQGRVFNPGTRRYEWRRVCG